MFYQRCGKWHQQRKRWFSGGTLSNLGWISSQQAAVYWRAAAAAAVFNCVNAYATLDLHSPSIFPHFIHVWLSLVCLFISGQGVVRTGGGAEQWGIWQEVKTVNNDHERSLWILSKSCHVCVFRFHFSRLDYKGVALMVCFPLCQSNADVLIWKCPDSITWTTVCMVYVSSTIFSPWLTYRSPFQLKASVANGICCAQFMVLSSNVTFKLTHQLYQCVIIIIRHITGNGRRENDNNDFRRKLLSSALYRLYRQRIIQTHFIN